MKPSIGEESFQDSSIIRPLRGLLENRSSCWRNLHWRHWRLSLVSVVWYFKYILRLLLCACYKAILTVLVYLIILVETSISNHWTLNIKEHLVRWPMNSTFCSWVMHVTQGCSRWIFLLNALWIALDKGSCLVINAISNDKNEWTFGLHLQMWLEGSSSSWPSAVSLGSLIFWK